MPVVPAPDTLDPEVFDTSLTPHVLTDKQVTKTCPCTECRRACVVTTFMAPVKVRCNDCRTSQTKPATGEKLNVVAGHTKPELAVNLADVLINKEFISAAVCPFDGEAMELKDVTWSDSYGPRHLLGYSNGLPQYKQERGEVAMFQCTECNLVLSLSTQHPHQFRRVNEPKTSARTGPSVWQSILGTRDEQEEAVAS